ncbi:hypothetical protein AGDE_06525 [Angomonas deanei]|nr:hypothetical protein AGDE_06525 [Angomonas deanei]|eukprot:EPY37409.1 hypothetical protein AGDE_06525 [Angomonas deanei]
MFRRISVKALASATAVRCYTPPADLAKLYDSNFDKEAFPTNIVPSDSVLFAKFLYKAAEPKKNFDAILKDFNTIAAAVPNLPVFWERTCRVEELKEFKGLSAPTVFTLQWMQSNGMLDLLPDVAEVYEAYVNAQTKRVSVKIYVAPGKAGDKTVVDAAKKAAEEAVKANKEFAGLTPNYKILVDRTIVDGFSLDVQGVFINKARWAASATATGATAETDFTTPPRRQPEETVFGGQYSDRSASQVPRLPCPLRRRGG